MTTQPTFDDAAHPLYDVLDQLDHRIPGWIDKAGDWHGYTRATEAIRCADIIAHQADALWHPVKPGRRPPEGAATPQSILDAIACAVGILAHRPGGIHLADLHWCRKDTACTGCRTVRPFDLTQVDTDPGRTGAHFTPDWIAQAVVHDTIPGVTCAPGPLHTTEIDEWEPGPIRTWWPIHVADIACGSGAFLLSAAKFLAVQISKAIVLHKPGAWSFTGATLRPLVIENCLYGTDINPWSVDLARLSLSLLMPHDATPNLDRRLIAGDALAGAVTTGPDMARLTARFPHRHPVHWADVFPEVFDPDAPYGPGFDAIVSNPPFLGGQKISGVLGADYRNYLVKEIGRGVRGSADLVAYFALRAHQLVNRRGQVGLIATNTLAQGATRRVGLDQIVADGITIRSALKSEPWPGTAALEYCMAVTTREPLATGLGGRFYRSLKPVPASSVERQRRAESAASCT